MSNVRAGEKRRGDSKHYGEGSISRGIHNKITISTEHQRRVNDDESEGFAVYKIIILHATLNFSNYLPLIISTNYRLTPRN